MTPEQAAGMQPPVMNFLALRGNRNDDYYLSCQGWIGRIFIELSSGAYLIADGEDGKPFLLEVEPYRPKPKSAALPNRRHWWWPFNRGASDE